MFGRREFLRRAGAFIGAMFAAPMIVRAAKPEPEFEFKPGTLQLIPIDKIIVDDSINFRQSDPSHLKLLKDSIMADGLVNPLTVSSSGVLIDGFARFEVIKALGQKKVLCYVCENRIVRHSVLNYTSHSR